MSAQHTPGWDYDASLGLVCEGDNVVAVVRGSDPDMADEEQDRRGRLIAAAPDMLAALGDAPIMSKYHGQHGFEANRFIADYEAWRVKARAAIAKAEGR